MAQRLHNLSKWLLLKEGEALSFENPKARTVVLEVNCPQEVAFYVTQSWDDVLSNPEWVEDREAGRSREDRERLAPGTLDSADDRLLTFVGLCKGRDTLEFAVDGGFELLCEGGPAYVYTFDGLRTDTQIVAPEIFTRIANRRQRNPHLELMQYQMKLNQQAFEAQMMAEMEHRLEAVKEGIASYAEQRDAGTASLRPAGAPGQMPGVLPAESEESAAADDAGDQSRDGGGSDKRKRKVRAAAVLPDEDDDA